jgi:WD40 repeat protein
LIREFRGHTDNVNTIAFSADGKIVASGGNDSTLRLWNASTGQAISSFASQHGAITDISFSSDGSMIAAGSSTNAFVSIWQTRTGQPVNSFERPPHYLVGLAFRPNSESILISTAPLAWILDAKSGTLVQSFILGSRCCRHVAFSPNGQTVAFSNQLWDVENRKLTRELDTNLTSLSFNTDGTKMVTVHSSQPSFVAGKGWISPPSEVKIWDATTGQMLNKIQGGNLDKILDLAFNANNKNILIAEGDSLIIRDSRTGAILQKLDRRVTTVAFSPDGRTFVTGNQDGTMQTWDAVTYDLQNTLNGHTGSISRITFSHDGRLLMSTSKDGTARVWDAKNWRTLQIITGNSFSLSPEGDMVAVARDGIYFIEAETGVPIRKFSDNKTKTLSFLYNSQSILADGIVYDVSTGSPLYRGFSTFPGLEVVFRMNSRFGIQDLGVWNSIIGSILGGARCDCAPSRMRGMAISPDARWIISGHYDSSIRIWGVKP